MRVDRVKFATELARADLNIKQLAAKSGLSRVTITSVKSGKSCSEATAQKLAAGLGINIVDILPESEH